MNVEPVQNAHPNGAPATNGAVPPAVPGHEGAPATVHELADHALSLSRSLPGPLQRLVVESGSARVEVDWHSRETVVPLGPVVAAAAVPVVPGAPVAEETAGPEAGTHTVRAPLVGTFYTAASPGEPPFVAVGDTVAAGQTVGIVEAMKLMNHITVDVSGTVVEVLAGNGEPVEFDQPLLRVAPATPGVG
ncbi:acetyl-CoA carboxylase biotin carboxyl carrier protein [Kineococcus sp. SYSU DK003]|uniref:acetyl-CoA carboxylase biotin carboxyl carrier protein n=1 Tax=Kineococcus sp. SYSU DK003 TaxID=3383124 RepID=UPI003D7F0CCC